MELSSSFLKRPIYALYDPKECSPSQFKLCVSKAMNHPSIKEENGGQVPFFQCITVHSPELVPPKAVVLCCHDGQTQKLLQSKVSCYTARGSVINDSQDRTWVVSFNPRKLFALMGNGGGMKGTEARTLDNIAFGFCHDINKVSRLALGRQAYYADKLNYRLLDTESRWQTVRQQMDSRSIQLIAVDIETISFPILVSAFGFTILWSDGSMTSYCIPMGVRTDKWHYDAMHYICGRPEPKALHNGKYDANVLLRHNVPVKNLLFDTLLMQHSISCEELKSLAYCSSVYLDNYVYWKSEIKGISVELAKEGSKTDIEEDTKGHGLPATAEGRLVYYKYCAKDTWYTMQICLAMLDKMLTKGNEWMWNNYCRVHFLQYRVGMFMGYCGMPINRQKLQEFQANAVARFEDIKWQLSDIADDVDFNPASTSQVQKLVYGKWQLDPPEGFKPKKVKSKVAAKKMGKIQPSKATTADLNSLLGSLDLVTASFHNQATTGMAPPKVVDYSSFPTDDDALQVLQIMYPERHNELQLLRDYREAAKIVSLYCKSDKLLAPVRGKPHLGLLMYSPNIGSTVTCRYGGADHDIGWGAYHLNLPPAIWKCIECPEGYVRYSIDYAHSDLYFVAYSCEDKNMIENAIRTDIDLHLKHAEVVFNVPYDKLVAGKKAKDPNIVDSTFGIRPNIKRIGHGADYLMGPQTLYVNMKPPAVKASARQLGYAEEELKSTSKLIEVCDVLLKRYYSCYPTLTSWHQFALNKLMRDNRLMEIGGWTRRFNGNIMDFRTKSALLAQYGQAGTSGNINNFLLKYFSRPYSLDNFIFAQIHDAVDGFCKADKQQLMDEMEDVMHEPTKVKGTITGTVYDVSVATEREVFTA